MWHQIREDPKPKRRPVFLNFDTFQTLVQHDELLYKLDKSPAVVFGGLDLTRYEYPLNETGWY